MKEGYTLPKATQLGSLRKGGYVPRDCFISFKNLNFGSVERQGTENVCSLLRPLNFSMNPVTHSGPQCIPQVPPGSDNELSVMSTYRQMIAI